MNVDDAGTQSPTHPSSGSVAAKSLDDDDVKGPEQQSAPFIPPCRGLALNRINDIIDFEIDHILYDKSTRLEHWESLSFFWSLHPAKNLEFGRRFLRQLICKVLVHICGQPAYGDPDEQEEGNDIVSEEEAEVSKRFPRLYALNREQWEGLEQDLLTLHATMQRKDAVKNYVGKQSEIDELDNPENAGVDLNRNQSYAFGKRRFSILGLFRAHKAIAPIRKLLEDRIAAKTLDGLSDAVPQDTIDAILAFTDTIEDDYAQTTVRTLFKETTDQSDQQESSEVDGDSGKKHFTLIEGEKLAELLRSDQFNLMKFQQSVEGLVQEMNSQIYSNFLSLLVQLRYTIEPLGPMDKLARAPLKSRRETAAILSLDDLRRQRTALNNEHGEDPLLESLRVSQPVAKGRKPRGKSSRKKPDAPATAAEDTTTGDDTTAPTPAKRARVRPPLVVAPSNPTLGTTALRRTPWSDEEKHCIKCGVYKYGQGNWVAIKEEYADVLRHRSNVQIKDCWRTMVKRGEVDESLVPNKESSKPSGGGGGDGSPEKKHPPS